MSETKYYTVYRRKTDMPVIVHEPIYSCVRKLGVSVNTFYNYKSCTKHGFRKCRYEIYEDEEENDEQQ